MKRASDPRHLARTLALQTLFAENFNQNKENIETLEMSDLLALNEITSYDEKLYEKIVEGVTERTEDIDALITKYAPQWPISQMKKVDLQILRISIFEGFLTDTTPPKVAMDEAIEISKDFGGEVNSKFINGVLGAIYDEKNKEHD